MGQRGGQWLQGVGQRGAIEIGATGVGEKGGAIEIGAMGWGKGEANG